TVTGAEAAAREAAGAQAMARVASESADAAAQAATGALLDAQRRVDAARRTVDGIAEREEADRLRARLAKIEALQAERDQICAQLSAVAVTEQVLGRIEDAAAAVDRLGAQLTLISAAVEFTAATDVELCTGDQRVSLSAGETWSITATGPTTVEVPDVLSARITPGAAALDAQAEHAAAHHELTAALAAGAVADLAGARSEGRRRRELESGRDRLTATLAGLCGDDDVDHLRARLTQLGAAGRDEAGIPALDAGAARAELDSAEQARAAADAACETAREAAAAARARLNESSTQATVLQNKAEAQRAELAAAAERLARERASSRDEDLAAAAQATLAAARAAEQRVADLAEQLAAAAPDAVAAELQAATVEATSLHERYEDAAGALREVGIELSVIGNEGRKGKLDAAETELEHATAEHARIGGRARAAQLLRSVMTRHRENTRLRYVEPYRSELQRLGRPVFGPTFEVDIDPDLCIRSRTLDGVTVPYESLSGGAKEQLGILARLAGAALVAKEDTVPVVVDDALGFTDPDRLATMGQVFDTVGAHGQVIVLTCSPGRYDGVKGAHRIDLDV
uniref:ATP-binding protein n=1 Tax=Mycobacterium sp. HUMS_1102779 TaxID=3383487 RepID=UPI00389AA3BE